MVEDTEVEVLWDQVDENLVEIVDDEDVVDRVLGWSILPLSLVTIVGYIAIWPMTISRRFSPKGVAMLCPPVEISLNPGKKVLVDVVVDGQFGSVECTYCTMKPAMNILLMMLASCMFHWDLNKLWPKVRLQWKPQNKQKTKKDLCECGCCWCHTVFNSHWSTKRKEK